MKVYEMIRERTAYAIQREAEMKGSPDLKAITIRISPEYITLADELAEDLDMNRQGFLGPIVEAAILEALQAYSHVFGDGLTVEREMLEKHGLAPTKWETPPKAEDIK